MDFFLIDGYNMSFRSFYAMPGLSRSDGFPTGALHAFFNGILRLSNFEAPHPSCVFFDKGGSVRHREIFPEYKKNRSEMPEDLRRQMPAIKEICQLFGFDIFEENGIEADDMLASMCCKLRAQNFDVSIVSSDKDFAQLVAPHVRQLLPPGSKNKDWTILDSIGVKTKFGVPPQQIPFLLALVGDAVDNIPGLNGIGPKTAAKWLKDFGDLETIIKRCDWLKPEKFREQVRENKDLLVRNLELVTLKTSIELNDPKNAEPDFEELKKFLEEMEMKRALTGLRKFANEVHKKDI